MKAENGCGELQQGYCSFPLHLLSKGVSDLMSGEDIWVVLMMPFPFCGRTNEDVFEIT